MSSTTLPLNDDESGKTLKLISEDKKEFSISQKFALIANLIKSSLENDQSLTELSIPKVNGETLNLIHQYMEHHKGLEPQTIRQPLQSCEMKNVCADKWDAEYIDQIGDKRQQLYDLIKGAHYFQIKSLVYLGSAKIASLIKGQPIDKLKEILNTDSNHFKQNKNE